MGSGASKDDQKPAPSAQAAQAGHPKKQAGAASAQDRVKKARDIVGHDKESDEFHNACMVVFQNADNDGDGLLDRIEFWNVLHSKSLNLNLSVEEKDEFLAMADVEQSGKLSYKEFVPIVKKLLQRVYQKKSNDWNDWCWVRLLFCLSFLVQISSRKGFLHEQAYRARARRASSQFS